ncbi:S-layer homology domain-containing protein [Carboxydocella sporoproducens DSM 16521]|uniref:S-layer homology domain-containing protein n=2 Tax=Carboxydocella TaxID=178898 RepID=A0A1T4L787_9FIRM|nr:MULTISPECIES: S-layer homology domain-containing protein [Carboxydocella]AVX19930.1 SLH domain-containing protein [Carboxydocella thermautotrophica]SJZ50572.1 S-layer homology domain-containing protein [Carboxydocella sporoproducens DSM 16521]
MRKYPIIILALLFMLFGSGINPARAAAGFSNVSVSFRHSDSRFVITGNFGDLAGKMVTLLIFDPEGKPVYIDQGLTGARGAFSFQGPVSRPVKGLYKIRLGGEGNDAPYETEYEYKQPQITGGGGSGGGGSSSPAPASAVDLGNSASSQVREEHGRQVQETVLDEARAAAALSQVAVRGEVNLTVSGTAAENRITIPSPVFKIMEEKAVTLEIQTESAGYTLPLQALEGQKANGGLVLTISKIKAEEEKQWRQAMAAAGLELAVTPVEFKVEVINDGQKQEVRQFNRYVSRTLYYAGTGQENLVGVVLNADGSFAPVPTLVTRENGKVAVVIKRRSNSTYAVVAASRRTFADLNQHWARKEVEQLAGRMIIKGIDAKRFNPAGKVTRAELAAMLVRALGLSEQQTGSAKAFSDVPAQAWYARAVAEATAAGLLVGYQDGRFRPLQPVSREEMAVILVRAMKLAGTEVKPETKAELAKLQDWQQISTWAQEDVAAAVKLELFAGDEKGRFNGGNKASRAETALVLQRLLVKAGLM